MRQHMAIPVYVYGPGGRNDAKVHGGLIVLLYHREHPRAGVAAAGAKVLAEVCGYSGEALELTPCPVVLFPLHPDPEKRELHRAALAAYAEALMPISPMQAVEYRRVAHLGEPGPSAAPVEALGGAEAAEGILPSEAGKVNAAEWMHQEPKELGAARAPVAAAVGAEPESEEATGAGQSTLVERKSGRPRRVTKLKLEGA